MLGIRSLCRPSATQYTAVRWRRSPRKPFWLGTAKSKIFRVPERVTYPPYEQEEIDRLKHIYNRQMLSITSFIAREKEAKVEKKQYDYEVQDKDSYLEEWNARSALLREQRLKEEAEKREKILLHRLEKNESKKKALEAEVDKIIETEIAWSAGYVTEKNIDKVIEECLANVKDYNFAMDLDGNVYMGTSKEPTDKLKLNKATEKQDKRTSDKNHLQTL